MVSRVGGRRLVQQHGCRGASFSLLDVSSIVGLYWRYIGVILGTYLGYIWGHIRVIYAYWMLAGMENQAAKGNLGSLDKSYIVDVGFTV